MGRLVRRPCLRRTTKVDAPNDALVQKSGKHDDQDNEPVQNTTMALHKTLILQTYDDDADQNGVSVQNHDDDQNTALARMNYLDVDEHNVVPVHRFHVAVAQNRLPSHTHGHDDGQNAVLVHTKSVSAWVFALCRFP